MKTEPSVIISFITALAAAILVLLVEFQVPITNGQQAAVQGLIAVLAPAIAGVVIRFNVFSPKTAERLEANAARTGTTTL